MTIKTESLAYVARVPKQAVAEKHKEQPLPLGLERQPYDADLSYELLTQSCSWTSNITMFVRNNLLTAKGHTFKELQYAAEENYFHENKAEVTFPLLDFNDFLRTAYRCGLITMNYVSPTGDPMSRDRIALFALSEQALPLLEAVTGDALKKETPSTTLKMTFDAETAPLIELLKQTGPIMLEDLLEQLTSQVPDRELDAAYDRYAGLIEQAIENGLLKNSEDVLGAAVLSLSEKAVKAA